ncbi:hypothetical protein GCM10027047_16710 [Rhodococcus aerolatus]
MTHPAAVNPLLPAAPPPPPAPERVETSAVLGDELAATYGPTAPLATPAPAGPGLPTTRVDTDPLLWVVGVHGGAGASTVAALLGSAGEHPDEVSELPQHLPDTGPGRPAPRVLLVARTHVTGLHWAAHVARHWASGRTGIDLVGLVVLDDAPTLPPVLAAEVRRVAGMVPALWHLPWVEAWRTELDLHPAGLPRRVRRSITQIRDHAVTAAYRGTDSTPHPHTDRAAV